MADLGTFDRPVLTDRYVDVLDTIRANILRIKASAEAAQDAADSALAAVGTVPDMLNDYMPKSGGRFTGDITTQRIVSESTIALQGLGGDFGTIITAGPFGGGQGAALQLNGALAQNSGFGNNAEWALTSPGHPTLVGGARLLWGGDDLGRWAAIDPSHQMLPAFGAGASYIHAGGDGVTASALELRAFTADRSLLHLRIDGATSQLTWQGADLGRWAPIDPASKLNSTPGTLDGWYLRYSAGVAPGTDVNAYFKNAKTGDFNGSELLNQMPWGTHPWKYYWTNSHGNDAGYTGIISMDFDGMEVGFKAISAGNDKGWKRIWHSNNFNPDGKVGMYTIGDQDLNELLTGGMYRMEGGNANRPDTAYGQLLVVRGGNDTVAQVAFDYRSPETYIRVGNPPGIGGGVWSGWARVWSSHNFDPGSKANLSHNTFSDFQRFPARGQWHAGSGTAGSNDSAGGVHVVADPAGNWEGTFTAWAHYPGVRYAQMSQAWHSAGYNFNLFSGGSSLCSMDFRFDGIIQTGNEIRAGILRCVSDISKKQDINYLGSPFNVLSSINGYLYTLKDLKQRAAGLIAQDVEKVLPEAVSKDDEGVRSLDYNAITAVLVNAVKELKAELDQLKGAAA